ncbi:MAG: hypothetical protein WC620_08545 [Methanoregula sp.]|jgi:hypothetical protein
MNDRRGKTPLPENFSPALSAGTRSDAAAITVRTENMNPVFLSPATLAVKPPVKGNGRKNHTLHKDSIFILRHDEHSHIISEDYSYKTDSYYTILQMERRYNRPPVR